MTVSILNRAKASTPTIGTGPLTLGSAVAPYLSWSLSGAVDGTSYSYLIEDGDDFEIDVGVYTAGVLTRPGPGVSAYFQSSTGALLNLSGAAVVSSVLTTASLAGGGGGGSSGALTLIATHAIANGDSGFAFTGIPATGKDLILVLRASPADNSANCYIRFNGDAGLNYNWAVSSHFEYEVNSTQAQIKAWNLSGPGYSGQNNSAAEMTIYDYARPTKKTTFSNCLGVGGGNLFDRRLVGQYNIAAVIASLTGNLDGATFLAGEISLYMRS